MFLATMLTFFGTAPLVQQACLQCHSPSRLRPINNKLPAVPQAASAETGPALEAGRRDPELALGDRGELSADLWAHGPLGTVDAGQFYRMLGRTGISYGPAFRMVERVATSNAEGMLRCAQK